jgi:hypothetical protein
VTASVAENELTAFALQRLIRAAGPADGPQAAREVFARLGIGELTSATDLLEFSEHLIARGGVFEAVGRGLKVSALLRGARA